MSGSRIFRWATTSARLLIGTVVAVVAVVAVVTAISIPWPGLAREPVAVVATPAPAATTVVCDGGLLVQGRDPGDAARLEVAAPQTVTVGVDPDTPEPDGTRLAAPAIPEGEGPSAYTVLPQGGARADVAASGSAVVAADDLVGYAASACRPPLLESWLVSGSAAVGAADLVVLANPGSSNATVQLTVFGANGPVIPPGGADVVVPAGGQRIVPLSGLALGETSPVIRVNAAGAPVHAFVQSSITRVLVPGGVDQAGAVSGTDDVLTIVGVAVTSAPAEATAPGEGAATVLRLLAPGSTAEATVSVRVLGDDDPAMDPVTVPLEAGLPTEVALSGLAPGEYVVDVVAGAPVVAGVWQATGFGEGSDFAWYLPAPPITVPTLFAVPQGPSATLGLVNADSSPASVTVRDSGGGGAFTVDLEPGESAAVPIERHQSYILDTAGAKVLAAVGLSATNALAGFPVWPADAAAPAITVFP